MKKEHLLIASISAVLFILLFAFFLEHLYVMKEVLPKALKPEKKEVKFKLNESVVRGY